MPLCLHGAFARHEELASRLKGPRRLGRAFRDDANNLIRRFCAGHESAQRLMRPLAVLARMSANAECLDAILRAVAENTAAFVRALQETNHGPCHAAMGAVLHNLLKVLVTCHLAQGAPCSSASLQLHHFATTLQNDETQLCKIQLMYLD